MSQQGIPFRPVLSRCAIARHDDDPCVVLLRIRGSPIVGEQLLIGPPGHVHRSGQRVDKASLTSRDSTGFERAVVHRVPPDSV